MKLKAISFSVLVCLSMLIAASVASAGVGGVPNRAPVPACEKANSKSSAQTKNPHCAQAPVDVCPNIDGPQGSIPDGMFINGNGSCVEDKCPNLNEGQETVPDGMSVNGNGDCVPDQCPNIDEGQESVPDGMIKNDDGDCVEAPTASLVGEFLDSDVIEVDDGQTSCPSSNTSFEASFSGTAYGPYPGIFTEHVSSDGSTATVTFTITSGADVITGSKTGPATIVCRAVDLEPIGTFDLAEVLSSSLTYTATLNGTTNMTGQSELLAQYLPALVLGYMNETFTS